MHESDARFPRDRWADLKNPFRQISGSICAPRGFKCASVFCDIKKLGTGKGSEKGQKRDLALIVSDVPAAVAGMFTTNQVCAAPVKVSAKRARKKLARAIVVNSGNANTCTGRQGIADAQQMARLSAATEAAVNRAICCASAIPCRPVQVFALPELTTMARASFFRARFALTFTGAAQT